MDKDERPYLLSHATPQVERVPSWLILIAYLAYLRAMQPQRPTEVTVLRTLLLVVGLVLTVVALVTAGAPELVVEMLQQWPALR